MKKHVTHYFEQLGLSENEANLYLTLLETGAISVRALAKKLDIPRSSTYTYIDLLLEKEIVMKLVSGSRTQVAAIPPDEALQDLVNQKVHADIKLQNELPQILETLQKDFPHKDKPLVSEAAIRYYRGVNNARKIYEEALGADELRSYIRIDKTEPLFPNNASVFSKAFNENPNLRVWEVIYDAEASAPPSKESRSRKGRYFYKYMPKSRKMSSEDILIFNGKVAVINFRGGKTSIVLQSRDLYNNFKEIFDLLWDMLPEPEAIES